ncbi:MAG TPA: TadE family type IV pilus minor pilin [Pseudonocardiaceae bacterium]|jgi:Flp pilus assembly protein TadG|nr:TadE family type IV pilus minor pilin [Pseudonocardiaceae bacterium]
MTRASRARGSPFAADGGTVPDGGTGSDSGAVTVEAAIALCGFIAVLAMVLAGLSAVLGQIRCTDAAGEAARLAARGDLTHARQVIVSIAGSDAKATFTDNGDTLTVEVVDDPLGGLLPGVRVRAQAFAVREPDPPAEPSEPTGSTPVITPTAASTTTTAPTTTMVRAPLATATSRPARRAEVGRR